MSCPAGFLNVVMVLVGPMLASVAPPEDPFPNTDWAPASKEQPATHLKMGSVEVRFEDTTLAKVIGAVKCGGISQQGDAGDSIYWLCYTAPNERIWIISHGEMGGDDHRVNGVSAMRMEGVRPTSDCPALPGKLQPVSLEGQIWLGTTEDQAVKILGKPSHRQGQWLSFDYQVNVPGDCEPDGFNLGSSLRLKIDKGRVVAVYAWRVTSC